MDTKKSMQIILSLIIFIAFGALFYGLGVYFPAFNNTEQVSFPDYKGFNDIQWTGGVAGTITNLENVDATKGTGTITIRNDNNSTLSFPLRLYIEPQFEITSVEKEVSTQDTTTGTTTTNAIPASLAEVQVGSQVHLTIERIVDVVADPETQQNTITGSNDVGVAYIRITTNQ